MPRRPLGPRARSHTGAARHRWAASLGPAGEDRLLDAPMAGAGLLPDGPPAEAPVPARAVFRWRTGRAAAALLAVVSLLLGGWFWWQAVDGAPRVEPLAGPSGTRPAGTGTAGAADPGSVGSGADFGPGSPAPGGQPVHDGAAAGTLAPDAAAAGHATGIIVVHVAGAVASPGVVTLPAGSRLHQAIEAAGGSTASADLDRLNLAAVLEDGQKILVQQRGSPQAEDPAGPPGGAAATGQAATGGTGGAGPGPPAHKINLNTAGAEELAALPRVGPVLAQRIVDWRKQHGRFGSVQELDAVEGVGPKLLAALLPLVSV